MTDDNTTLDESHLLSLVRSFLLERGTPSGEAAGCILWDISTSPGVASILIRSRILDAIELIISEDQNGEHSHRMTEISLGILANFASHDHVCSCLLKDDLPPLVITKLWLPDPGSISEASRLLSVSLRKQGKEEWISHVNSGGVLEQLLNISQNTLDAVCLERCLDCLVAILHSNYEAGTGGNPLVDIHNLTSQSLTEVLSTVVFVLEVCCHQNQCSSQQEPEVSFLTKPNEVFVTPEAVDAALRVLEELTSTIFKIGSNILCNDHHHHHEIAEAQVDTDDDDAPCGEAQADALQILIKNRLPAVLLKLVATSEQVSESLLILLVDLSTILLPHLATDPRILARLVDMVGEVMPETQDQVIESAWYLTAGTVQYLMTRALPLSAPLQQQQLQDRQEQLDSSTKEALTLCSDLVHRLDGLPLLDSCRHYRASVKTLLNLGDT